jgi:sigma-B regulation protein RsbU (phosphoserine phosphatase)
MEKWTFANRLSLRIMAVLLLTSAAIMCGIYLVTRESMAREVESRY